MTVNPSGQVKRHIIPLEGFHKRFRHPVALRTLDRGPAHPKTQVSGKLPCFMGGITRSVVGEPLDQMWEPINEAKPGFHTLEHQVPDIVPSDATRGGHITQDLPITGIQAEGDSNPFSGNRRGFQRHRNTSGDREPERSRRLHAAVPAGAFPGSAEGRFPSGSGRPACD